MSPIDAGRIIGKESSENHPLIETIKSGGHASPSQIRSYGFGAAVKPHILADAVYNWQRGRNTDEPELVHPADTYVRDSVWKLNVRASDPDQAIAIYDHDMTEHLAKKNVGGSCAIPRWLGEMFGSYHEGIALSLTNIRNNAIFKQLEDMVRDERIKSPNPHDVYGMVSIIRKRAGSKGQQTRAYDTLASRVHSYLVEMDTFGWGYDDIDETRKFLEEALGFANALAKNPIPQREVKRRANPFFDDLINDAAHLVESPVDYGGSAHSMKRPDCVLNLADNESDLMHMLDHIQYERYAKDLFSFSVAMLQDPKLSQFSHIPIVTKLLEDADNVRKQPKLSQYQEHTTYSKAKLWIDIGESYTDILRKANDPRAQIVEFANKFLKTELLFRAITDRSQVTAQRDRDYREHWRWLAGQFIGIRQYVGPDIEAKVFSEIQNLGKSRDENERQTGENLNHAYENLAKGTPNGANGAEKRGIARILGMLGGATRRFDLW